MNKVTGTDAGLTGKDQIEIAVKAIFDAGGSLDMKGIYAAVEKVINPKGFTLSFQGQSSLRFFVNKVAVKRGLIKPHDKSNPGWHITNSGRSLASGKKVVKTDDNYCLPTEESSGNFVEGAKQQILVNRYERSPGARRECIEHYGCVCQVCNLSFADKYGSIGDGFIHVHHTVPLHSIGKEYQVDPIKDLIPLCPNCHSMIHSTEPMLSVAELKEKINALSLIADLL